MYNYLLPHPCMCTLLSLLTLGWNKPSLTYFGVIVSNFLHRLPDNFLVVTDRVAGDLSKDEDHSSFCGTLCRYKHDLCIPQITEVCKKLATGVVRNPQSPPCLVLSLSSAALVVWFASLQSACFADFYITKVDQGNF